MVMAKGWYGSGLHTRNAYRRKRANRAHRIEKRARARARRSLSNLGKLSRLFVATW